MNDLHFTVDVSILAREGETVEETEQRLNDVLMEALTGLVDHEIGYCIIGRI